VTPIDLPPEVAQKFVADMRAFFAEYDQHKADAIAACQLDALNRYRKRGTKRLRLSDVKRMFFEMRDHLDAPMR
jgi:hypothetical protein